jgi:hypothetical protein
VEVVGLRYAEKGDEAIVRNPGVRPQPGHPALATRILR